MFLFFFESFIFGTGLYLALSFIIVPTLVWLCVLTVVGVKQFEQSGCCPADEMVFTKPTSKVRQKQTPPYRPYRFSPVLA